MVRYSSYIKHELEREMRRTGTYAEAGKALGMRSSEVRAFLKRERMREYWYNQTIEALQASGLPTRARNVLMNMDWMVGDPPPPESKLRQQPNCGHKTVQAIRDYFGGLPRK